MRWDLFYDHVGRLAAELVRGLVKLRRDRAQLRRDRAGGGDYLEELHGSAGRITRNVDLDLRVVAALAETQITVPSNYGRVWDAEEKVIRRTADRRRC